MCPVFLNAKSGKPGHLIPWPNLAFTSLCVTRYLRCSAPCSSATGTVLSGFPKADSVTRTKWKPFIWAAQRTPVGRGKWHRKGNSVLTGCLEQDSWGNATIKHTSIIWGDNSEERRNRALAYQLLHSVFGWELLLGVAFLSSFLAAFLKRQKNGVSGEGGDRVSIPQVEVQGSAQKNKELGGLPGCWPGSHSPAAHHAPPTYLSTAPYSTYSVVFRCHLGRNPVPPPSTL